jgi:hypothetical protein
LLIDPVVDDVEIVGLWKHMFIDQVHPSLLRCRAFPVAIFDEATVSFLSLVSLRSNEWIMILLDMQIQESICREILPTL